MVNDPYCNDLESQMWAFENMGNQTKIAQVAKEYNLYHIAQAYVIQLPCPYIYNFWQPWVKNYHGENTVGYGNEPNWVKYTWLDQELKYKMTGRK